MLIMTTTIFNCNFLGNAFALHMTNILPKPETTGDVFLCFFKASDVLQSYHLVFLFIY